MTEEQVHDLDMQTGVLVCMSFQTKYYLTRNTYPGLISFVFISQMQSILNLLDANVFASVIRDTSIDTML